MPLVTLWKIRVAAATPSRSRKKMMGVKNTKHAERLRGLKESAANIEVLRSLWPAAFPEKSHLVRPLTEEAAVTIAERTGWSPAYARGVLAGWKNRSAYCKAVLWHDRRWTLDGQETEAVVDAEARETARKQLAVTAASAEKKKAKMAARGDKGQ